jgi:hypothetical protein
MASKNSKMENTKVEIVEFKTLRQGNSQLNLPDAKELSELRDVSFIITGFEIYNLTKYQLAIVKVRFNLNDNDRLYRTTSSVIIRQLNELVKPILEQGKYVKATIIKPKGKRYYTLA